MTFDYLKMPGVFMHKEERELIKNLSSYVYRIFKPTIIVQIGTAWGGSVYCSRAGAPSATIYGVDMLGLDELRGTEEQKAELNCIEIRGKSQEITPISPIHFLYIDGDHWYEPFISDLRRWASQVVPGGYMACHDAEGSKVSPDVNKGLGDWFDEEKWVDEGKASWSRYFRRIN